MERFNYLNIDAVLNEDTYLLYLLDCESYGIRRDEQEKLAELEAQGTDYG
jgi:hypothetical protein